MEQGGMCMKNNQEKKYLDNWLSITNIQMGITNELESALQKNHNLSIEKEFYVLYLLSKTSEKQLRLQQLQEMVGLKSKCYIQAGSQA